jgi:ferredoxin
MVKRLVKVPFVNMRVMFPREENRKDVTFKMRRGASLRAELLRNRVEMPTCCEDMNCLCNCAVRVRAEITIEQTSRRWRGG